MLKILLLSVFCLLAALPTLDAQRVLLLENMRSSRADRYYEGQTIVFRVRGDNFWQNGVITELRPDIQSIVINDRFVMLDEVEAVQLPGAGFATGVGYSLMTFGLGWSAFALVGYATDGQADTRYSGTDLGVTLVSVGSGFLLKSIFAKRQYKLSERKRLRIIDLSF